MKKQIDSKPLTTKDVKAQLKAGAPKGKVSAAKLVKHLDSKAKQVSSKFVFI